MYIIVPLRSLGNANIRQEKVFLVWVFSQYSLVTYTKSRAYFFEELYFCVLYAIVSLDGFDGKRYE